MIQSDYSLKSLNTFGLEVQAKYFARFTSVEELQHLLSQKKEEKLLILGGGSNILFTKDIDAFVLRNEIKGITRESETDSSVYLRVGAGEVWHDFVLYCVKNGLGGVENLSLIPGSVGASPMQNIGAYGVEIKDVFEELVAYEIETGKLVRFSKEACAFGYRESVFKRALKNKYIIVSVLYKLAKQPTLMLNYGNIQQELSEKGIMNPSIEDVSNAVIAIRQSKLPNPAEIGNAGSFFKNPVISKDLLTIIQTNYPTAPFYPIDENQVKIPAGWLIETAGWKGKTIDTHGVHKNQALVLVNYGGATGSEILDLSQAIIDDILQKFEIHLEREVNIL